MTSSRSLASAQGAVRTTSLRHHPAETSVAGSKAPAEIVVSFEHHVARIVMCSLAVTQAVKHGRKR
jgi:hypothetical protein